MATPDQAYYAYYLRQHRVLGAYLALHCWHNGYDAVIVDRSTLAHMHELTHFTEKHLSWLQRDIRPYFSESTKLYYSGSTKFAAVVLSRVELPQGFTTQRLQDEARAKQWRAKGFRVAALSELPTCSDTFTEKIAAAFLTLVGAGLCVPEPPPKPQEKPARFVDPFTIFANVFTPKPKEPTK
jgi:hypothetical protein